MSAYKQFLASDVIVSPFEVNKGFSFNLSQFTGVGINRFLAQSGSFLIDKTTTGLGTTEYSALVFSSIKHLYYSNFLTSSRGDIAQTGSIILGVNRESDVLVGPKRSTNYYNYPQTTLSQSRIYSDNAKFCIVSIPSRLYGTQIKPGSFRYLDNDSSAKLFTDDGEGNILSGSTVVGNIIYEHGLMLIGFTGSMYGSSSIQLASGLNVTCSFQSTITVYETQYKCTITENDFNYTLNPSTVSGSNGTVYSYVTASYFEPYVTTIGLYNDDQDLIAVAKIAQPVPTSATTDMNIIINLDS
jgi:hypothetical protein